MEKVTVLGAGLAGSECAWQLAKRNIPVRLMEMKPEKKTPAHVSDGFAELVCSILFLCTLGSQPPLLEQKYA